MAPRTKHAAFILAAALALPGAARAKVVFTGYGDLRLDAYTPFKINGDPAALATFGLTDTSPHHARGFNFDSVGLFATTSLAENMDFKVDFNYRQIGQNVNQIRLQYAYLEHRLDDDWSYRAGKITLPFGYYNQNRFYSFQRVELQSPVFQTAILGLPIADVGVGAQKQLPTASTRWVLDAYAVNGYGGQPSAPNEFRSPTILNGITISNNLGATNNNANIAFGGRVAAADIAGKRVETGLSYYGGAWDPSGSKWFQMFNAYLHSEVGRVDLLAELLHLDTSGDPGFQKVVGDTHWQTSGYFLEASMAGFSVFSRPLTPYVGAEGYVSEGHNGQGSQEKIQEYRAGAQLKPLENVAVKAEYSYLWYGFPIFQAGEVRLYAHQAMAALVVTF